MKNQTSNLKEREKELKEINTTKTRLFSIIGHDLRGPIGSLQDILKLFSQGDMDEEELQTFLPKLRSDVDHIFFTLNNLLSWGHAQTGGTIIRKTTITLNVVVDHNINLLSDAFSSKKIKVLNEIKQEPKLNADKNHIDIIIRNILSNAIKFTPENGLVSINATEQTKHWEIAIRDTGIGMDDKTAKKIFEDNVNLTTYGTNNEKGTGLGLALCKELVKKNDGEIWVESQPKKGTTFFFTIPKKVVKTYKKTAKADLPTM